MTERLIVHSRMELEKYKQVISDNLLKSARVIEELIRDSSALLHKFINEDGIVIDLPFEIIEIYSSYRKGIHIIAEQR